MQKEQALQNKYDQDQSYKLASFGRDITGLASDYQSKYGRDAANDLSKYYKLDSNIYNTKVATGGVTSGGLSSIYKPGSYNFGSGSRIKEQQIDINTRAAKKLANQGNQLYRDWETDRKSTRLNSSHRSLSRMPSSA